MTDLSTVVVPEIVAPQVALAVFTKSALFQAGVIQNFPAFGNFAGANFGQLLNYPKYDNIVNDTDQPNISNDDDADTADPKSRVQTSINALKLMLNQAWGAMNLVNALSSPDPMAGVVSEWGNYWARQVDRYGIAASVGILADNVANDGGDMVVDVSDDDTTTDDSMRISSDAIIDATATMGDHYGDIVAMYMHSAVFADLQKINAIEYVSSPSDANVRIPFYQDKQVIVSDLMPAELVVNKMRYLTILAAAGSLGFGLGAPERPASVEWKEDIGNGEGGQVAWSRYHFMISPINYSFSGTQGADYLGQSPTLVEMAAAANWTRPDGVNRKHVGIAGLWTNAGDTVIPPPL